MLVNEIFQGKHIAKGKKRSKESTLKTVTSTSEQMKFWAGDGEGSGKYRSIIIATHSRGSTSQVP